MNAHLHRSTATLEFMLSCAQAAMSFGVEVAAAACGERDASAVSPPPRVTTPEAGGRVQAAKVQGWGQGQGFRTLGSALVATAGAPATAFTGTSQHVGGLSPASISRCASFAAARSTLSVASAGWNLQRECVGSHGPLMGSRAASRRYLWRTPWHPSPPDALARAD